MPVERLTPEEARTLYLNEDLHSLAAAADRLCRRLHPEPWRTFAIDRNINYTNVCRVRCGFCAFSVDEGDGAAYVLSRQELLEKIAALSDAGGTHVLLQGGLHAGLDLAWHVQMLRDIARHFPKIAIHAYSPPEIQFISAQAGVPLEPLLGELREAGLASIPGGGAEILVDRARQLASPGKCSAAAWLEVMRAAHRLGMNTTATMMFGHVETPQERLEHLDQLRRLQDESLAAGRGRFTAFIPWTFQSGCTPLGARGVAGPVGCVEYLRTLAVSRLYLDNFANVQGSWVTQGPRIGQLTLLYGANDLGGVMMEENVVRSAGTSYQLSPEQMRRLIEQAGFQARQRDCAYRLV